MARLFDDAVPQYLTAAVPPVTIEPCSIACWFNVDLAALQTLVGILDTGGGGLGGFMLMAGASQNVNARTKGVTGNSQASSSTTFTLSTWNHACGVFASATDRRAFLNGGGKGTNAVSRVVSGIDTLGIGAQVEAAVANPTSGSIDHVGVWNIALSDAEVALLATHTPDMVRRDALVFYAKLIGGELLDVIGGQTLTDTGGSTTSARVDGLIYPCAWRRGERIWTPELQRPRGRAAGFVPFVPIAHPALLRQTPAPWLTQPESLELMAVEA